MGSISKAWVLLYSVVIVVVTMAGCFVASGPTGLDRTVMTAIEGTRSDGLTSTASLVSELFSPVLVPVWAVLVAGALLVLDRSLHRAVALLASVIAAAGVAEVIKLVVARPRPPAPDQIGAYEATLSYPSGHVTGTAALLVALALVVTATAGRAARFGAVTLALAVTVLVASTRLYLGVHWLTDVFAAAVVGISTSVFVVAATPVLIEGLAQRVGQRVPRRAAAWLAPSRPAGRHALAEVTR